jgi:AcrR family transcriptional regulator
VTQERGRVTRERILAAAAREFDERGYAGASIGRVAERLGTAKGLVSYHFPTKALLAEAVVASTYTRRPFVGDDDQPLRGIRSVAVSCFRVAAAFQASPVARAAVRLQGERVDDLALPTPYVGWMSVIEATLREAQEDREIDSTLDATTEAWTLVAAFFGVQSVSGRLSGHDDLRERVAAWLVTALRGLGAQDAAGVVDQARRATAPPGPPLPPGRRGSGGAGT